MPTTSTLKMAPTFPSLDDSRLPVRHPEQHSQSSTPARSSLEHKRAIERVCCIGAGYVGGPTAAVVADNCPRLQITVVDVDEKRIAAWNSENLPVYEPDLASIVRRARDGNADEGREPNLRFTTDIDQSIREAQIVFVGVNTPTKRSGLGAGKAFDLDWLESATRRIARVATHETTVVEKSTVSCGTADSMRQILSANARPGVRFEVLSNPEFLAEGTAITNLLNPDRILIGCSETSAGYAASHELADIYASWIPREKIITMNLWSSELSKLAANAMLAQRISSINALSSICEAVSANVQDVAYACGLDHRIGSKMLNASVGFGGSCFRKDVMNLVYISESLNLPEVAAYWESILLVNEYQKDRFTRRIVKTLHGTLSSKKLAILGFAYKKNTGDTRESPAITIVNNLLAENAEIAIYDPKVSPEQIQSDLRLESHAEHKVTICSNAYEACQDAHAAVILTEWNMFSNRTSTSKTGAAEGRLEPRIATSSDGPLLDEAMSTIAAGINMDSLMESEGDSADDSASLPSSRASSAPSTSSVVPTSQEKLDWASIAKIMQRPMYVFDGRNTIDVKALEELGFRVEAIGVMSSGQRQRQRMSFSEF